jgi:FdhD protein
MDMRQSVILGHVAIPREPDMLLAEPRQTISSPAKSHDAALLGRSRRVVQRAWRSGAVQLGERTLAEEVPVAMSYDGTTYAVLMATPDDLEDFALGFSHTEGLISAAADMADLSVIHAPDGIELRMWLANDRSEELAARRRRQVGPVGCGLCGIESLAEANRPLARVTADARVSHADIENAMAALPVLQSLNIETRSVHAAAFRQPDGRLLVREDVGRHNALDKLAGALLRRAQSAGTGIVVLSSRISIELVQKAAMMGAPIVAAISAPTALAVRAATTAGITLVGIARDDGFEVFTHAERIGSVGVDVGAAPACARRG